LGASIGLMNIMLVSVTERTREIGIRKSLGASRQHIKRQFLVEAIVICQMGGLLGILLGVGMGNLMGIFFAAGFIVPWKWMISGVVLCFLVGVVSGLYPAVKASKLDPIEALRHE
ncbi:MAG: ABC transporter permease, partial [Bacteroidota bacterium]